MDLPDTFKSAFLPFFETWKRGGWIGVDLFFCLSGFLIGGLLFTEYLKFGSISIGRFYIRRGFKIYPMFYFFIAITLLNEVLHRRFPPLPSLCSEILFLQSYIPGVWNHTWSLAVEEHFYLCLPLILLLVFKQKRISVTAALSFCLVLAALVGLVARINLASRGLNADIHNHFMTHIRVEAMLFGVVLCWLYKTQRTKLEVLLRGMPWLLMGSALGLLCLPFLLEIQDSKFLYIAGYPLTWLASGTVLILSVAGLPVSLGNTSLLRLQTLMAAVGRFSYGIYLWHLPVKVWLIPAVRARVSPEHEMWLIALYLSLSIAVGVIVTKLLEQPVLALRDKIFPSKIKTTAV